MNNGFQYVSTFISLILGLAVANLLAGFADYLKNRGKRKWYWLHGLWAVYLMTAIASEWWVSLNWLKVPSINYFQFIFMLGKPSTLFFAATLLMPNSDEQQTRPDLAAHYWSISRPFFLGMAAYLLLDTGDTLLKGMDHFHSLGLIYPISTAIGLALTLWAATVKEARVHVFVLVVGWMSMTMGMINALPAIR